MIRVENQKAFVRTRSTYSRLTMANVFFQFIVASRDRPGLFEAGGADGVEVDLLELGLLLRERLDTVAVQRAPEELAPVRARRERDDEGAVEGLRARDAGQRGHVGERRIDGEPKQVLRVPALELLHRALEDLPGAGHQADLVAELLRLLEHVRAEDDRFAARPEVQE